MSIEILCNNILDIKRKQNRLLSNLSFDLIYNKLLVKNLKKLNKRNASIINVLEKMNVIYAKGESVNKDLNTDKKLLYTCLEDVNDESDYLEDVGIIRTIDEDTLIRYILSNLSNCYFKKRMKEMPKKCYEELSIKKYYNLYIKLYRFYTKELSNEEYINIKLMYNYLKVIRNDDKCKSLSNY